MKTGSIRTVAMGTATSTLLVGPNPRRTRLEISSPSTTGGTLSPIFIRDGTVDVATLGGFPVGTGQPWLVIDRDSHGDFVTKEFHGLVGAASTFVGIIEIEEVPD